MRLTRAERLILDNQHAIMTAIAYPDDAREVLRPRLVFTNAALVKRKPRKRLDPRKMGHDAWGPGTGPW